MNIRIATPDDASRIVELEAQAGCRVPLDMAGAETSWLVAELDGTVQAAVQALLGKPFSALEMLAINPDLSPHVKARIVMALLPAGFQALHATGAQYCVATIPFRYKRYRRALEKRGCVVMDQGSVLVKRLR